MRQTLAVVAVAGLLQGCVAESDLPDVPEPDLPSQTEIEAAKAELSGAVASAEGARAALELLGILPSYECGEPRRTFVGRVVEELTVSWSCATFTTAAVGDQADVVTVTFAAAGCPVTGHTLGGTLVLRYSGGEDRMDLELDARALVVDGALVGALAGYGTCGDETRYWALAEGDGYRVDVQIAKRDGIPLIGGTTLLIDGSAQLTDDAGTDSVAFTGVEYEVGDLLPRHGTIVIQTAAGRRIEATFDLDSPIYGSVRLVIDAHDAVTIYLPA